MTPSSALSLRPAPPRAAIALLALAAAACGTTQTPAPAPHSASNERGTTPTTPATPPEPAPQEAAPHLVGAPSHGPAADGACEAASGRCVNVGACGEGAGHIGGPDVDSCVGPAGTVCCVPTCAGSIPGNTCCQGSYTTRPTCVGGTLQCTSGTPGPCP
jgi:hypothetical protein